MKLNLIFKILIIFMLLANFACQGPGSTKAKNAENIISVEASKKEFISVMEKHLNAVTNRDLETLASTLSPDGNMQLILPKTEIINSVDSFIAFHKEWFSYPDWTFETKILNTEIGTDLGMAVTELTYREPKRNGVPYFNRQIVTYVLKRYEEGWKIIKDHCSSVEKSTDQK